ncbi:MAG: SDR family oxidoreductase [Thermoanaerobaculia bacterium]
MPTSESPGPNSATAQPERSAAVVTGGSRGIGFAIARRLAALGYDLVLVARDAERLRHAAKLLIGGYAIRVETVAVDLQTDDASAAVVAACCAAGVQPTVLVHCAGIFIDGVLADAPTKAFDEAIAVNVRPVFELTRDLLPIMRTREGARIVIIGSTVGLEPYRTGPLYSVSKWAVRGYAVNLRDELKREGVAVTLVNPGSTYTDMYEGEDVVPAELLQPEDVAHVVVAALTVGTSAVVEEVVIRPLLGDRHQNAGQS